MMLGLSLSIKQPSRTLAQLIHTLFAQGEQGAWYDPSDFSTLFQDAAGTTPVTAVEQPVGKILDKSGRGNHASQATSTKRPVLSARVNLLTKTEDFSDAVWSVNVKDGDASVAKTPNYSIAPDGTTTACRVLAAKNTTGTYGVLRYAVGGVSIPHTSVVSTWIKSNTGVNQTVGFTEGSVDFATVVATPAWTPVQSLPKTGSAASIYFDVGLSPSSQASIDVSIWHPHFDSGSTATRYQRVNTATDYDATGFNRKETLDGVDDAQVTTTGGGASTSAMIVLGFKSTLAGAAQTLWTDRTGNTGLKLEKTAANVIAFSGGNGASINTATGNAIVAGTDYVVTALYDGINLSVQLNSATPVTAACTLSAGQAAITLGADTGAAAAFFKGGIYEVLYIKDDVQSASQISDAKRFVAGKSGVSL